MMRQLSRPPFRFNGCSLLRAALLFFFSLPCGATVPFSKPGVCAYWSFELQTGRRRVLHVGELKLLGSQSNQSSNIYLQMHLFEHQLWLQQIRHKEMFLTYTRSATKNHQIRPQKSISPCRQFDSVDQGCSLEGDTSVSVCANIALVPYTRLTVSKKGGVALGVNLNKCVERSAEPVPGSPRISFSAKLFIHQGAEPMDRAASWTPSSPTTQLAFGVTSRKLLWPCSDQESTAR